MNGEGVEGVNKGRPTVREEFEAVGGEWGAAWERLAEVDPAFVRACAAMTALPARDDSLGPKVRALVGLAVDVAATGPYAPGIRRHVRAALEAGAGERELLEVLEVTSTVGVHAATLGVPLLLEVLREEGLRGGPRPPDARDAALRAEFTATRGYWDAVWDDLLDLDPEMFAAYLDFSGAPWRTGVLEPRVRELVYIAFDAAATHLYAPGLKLHLRNAVRLGVSARELTAVLEIAGLLGVRAVETGVPVVVEEVAARRERPAR